MLLLEQMSAMLLIMCVGYLCRRKGIITEEVSGKLSFIVVNIANPAMILGSSMGEERIAGRELLVTAVLAAAIYAALILLAQLLPRLLRIDEKRRGEYHIMTVFSNIGFMGFPIISALYGQGALLYAAVFVVALNILIYTYGIREMKGTGKKGSVINAGTIACMAAFAVYLSGIPVPEFIRRTVEQLGNLTTPLSMMVIGASIASMKWKDLIADKKLTVFALIRLLAVPLAGTALIRLFIGNEVISGVCMVVLAAPVAGMTAMLAQQYGGDQEMTARGVALTTVLSAVTMPLVQWLIFR